LILPILEWAAKNVSVENNNVMKMNLEVNVGFQEDAME